MADVFGIASVMPFMAMISNPDSLDGNPWVESFKLLFSISEYSQLVLVSSFLLMIILMMSLTIKAFYLRSQIRFALILEQELCDRLVSQYLRKPYEWSLSKNTADIGKTVMSEVNHVVNGLVVPVIIFVTQLIACLAIISFLLILDPFLTLSAGLAIAAIYGALISLVRKYLLKIGKKTFAANRERFKILSEAFGAIREVKLLQLHDPYFNNFSKNAKVYFKNFAISQVISQIPRFAVEALAFCSMLICIQYLVLQTGSIQTAIPIISGFAFAVYRLMPAIQQLYANFAQAQHTIPAVISLVEELSQPQIIKNELVQKEIKFNKKVEIEKVNFKYPNSENDIFQNLDLIINKGEFVGILGPSGEGKSTFLDLLTGLLIPSSGKIKVDGIELCDENVASWQNKIGYVSQNIYLVDGTIETNIALGDIKSTVNREQIEKVAKLSKLDKFIKNYSEKGYQSTVGERGSRLSGGQRQRMGVARALYKFPSLLVLDEATSSLDTNSEKFIMDTIYDLKGTATAIIVSHNAANLARCDKLYLVENGLLKMQR